MKVVLLTVILKAKDARCRTTITVKYVHNSLIKDGSNETFINRPTLSAARNFRVPLTVHRSMVS